TVVTPRSALSPYTTLFRSSGAWAAGEGRRTRRRTDRRGAPLPRAGAGRSRGLLRPAGCGGTGTGRARGTLRARGAVLRRRNRRRDRECAGRGCPMTARVGETTDPAQLIPGQPQQTAGDLRGVGGTLPAVGEVGGMLGRIDPANWIGEASNVFRDAFGAEPPKWLGLVDTVARGGQTLADYADVLTWAQGEAQRAIEMHTQA